MNSFSQDIRYAFRSLRRSPGFAITAVLCLAAGIGATTVMFGIVDTLFLQPPPGVHEPGRVLRLSILRRAGMMTSSDGGSAGSYPNYLDLRQATHGFSSVAAYSSQTYSIGLGANARRVTGDGVTASYFTVLGARPALGRFFASDEDTPPGPHHVVVISHRLWQAELGGRPDALGRTIVIENKPYTVVGVTEPYFRGESTDHVDVWVPITETGDFVRVATARMAEDFNCLGRLAPAVPVPAALREATTFVERGDQTETSRVNRNGTMVPILDPHPVVLGAPLLEARGPDRAPQASVALWLFGAVMCVLFVACVNLTNLLLARGTRRRRELAVRVSLGAGRGRIVRQLLIECGVIVVLGAILGLVLRVWGDSAARYFDIADGEPAITWRIVAFAGVTATMATLMAGLAPALILTRGDLTSSLKDGTPHGATSYFGVQSWLLGGQAALSVIVLAAAGLFLRSLERATTVDLGVDADHVVLASVDLKAAHYDSAAAAAIYDRIVERIGHLPGITAAAVQDFPMFQVDMSFPLALATGPVPSLPRSPSVNFVGPGYLAAAGARLILGRDVTDRDRAGTPSVAVISEILARTYWPGQSPLGQCLKVGIDSKPGQSAPCTQVIGVAADTREEIAEAPFAHIYLPRAQHSIWSLPTVLIRTRGSSATLTASVRAAITDVAPNLPYVDVRPLREELRGQIQPYRTGAVVFTGFGVATLILAALGLYGVVAYIVAQRTRDIGIRVALGAGATHVVTLTMRQGMVPMLGGVVVGVAGAIAASGLLRSRLYGVSPTDPATFAIVVALISAVAALACFVPARRAARVDPVIALRAE